MSYLRLLEQLRGSTKPAESVPEIDFYDLLTGPMQRYLEELGGSHPINADSLSPIGEHHASVQALRAGRLFFLVEEIWGDERTGQVFADAAEFLAAARNACKYIHDNLTELAAQQADSENDDEDEECAAGDKCTVSKFEFDLDPWSLPDAADAVAQEVAEHLHEAKPVQRRLQPFIAALMRGENEFSSDHWIIRDGVGLIRSGIHQSGFYGRTGRELWGGRVFGLHPTPYSKQDFRPEVLWALRQFKLEAYGCSFANHLIEMADFEEECTAKTFLVAFEASWVSSRASSISASLEELKSQRGGLEVQLAESNALLVKSAVGIREIDEHIDSLCVELGDLLKPHEPAAAPSGSSGASELEFSDSRWHLRGPDRELSAIQSRASELKRKAQVGVSPLTLPANGTVVSVGPRATLLADVREIPLTIELLSSRLGIGPNDLDHVGTLLSKLRERGARLFEPVPVEKRR